MGEGGVAWVGVHAKRLRGGWVVEGKEVRSVR